jgi:hypothetical protein
LRAELDKRIGNVPYEPAAMVWTAWDLGIRDATAIWFVQVVGREIRIIDHNASAGSTRSSFDPERTCAIPQ